MEEPVEEEEVGKEVDMGEAPPIGDSAPEQALAPWVTLPMATGFWVGCPSDQVARKKAAASLRAWGKAPTIQVQSSCPWLKQTKS